MDKLYLGGNRVGRTRAYLESLRVLGHGEAGGTILCSEVQSDAIAAMFDSEGISYSRKSYFGAILFILGGDNYYYG